MTNEKAGPAATTGSAAAQATDPDPRVLFAAERTLLAWIRTGLSLMGFGFVVARFGLFLREMVAVQRHGGPTPPGLSLWIGTALVILGVLVNAIVVPLHVRTVRRINRGESLFPAAPSPGIYVAAVLVALGVTITAYLVAFAR